MKKHWQKLAARVDALALRERVMVFAAVVAVLVFVLYSMVLDPLLVRQAQLREKIAQDRTTMTAIDTEVTAAVLGHARDPDEQTRSHLQALQSESEALQERLRSMETALVAPERIAPLLETILRANGRLKLVGMKTLPVTVMNPPPAAPGAAANPPQAAPQPNGTQNALGALAANGSPAPAAPAAPLAGAASPAPLLYRHGVEITVRGNYLDMVDYLQALQSLPQRLFWGRAELQVETYPDARLTLTLYTMSLDQKWMTL